MAKEDLLDDDLSVKANMLTDDQLVGILSESVQYPEQIIHAVQTELDWRQIDEDTLDHLKAQYLQPIRIAGKLSISFGPVLLLILVMIFRYAFHSFLGMTVGLSVLFISLLALRRRFQKGPGAAQTTWKIFGGVYLALFVLVFLLALAF